MKEAEVIRYWGGWIRTSEWRYQKPQPYHLATPQFRYIYILYTSAISFTS